MKKSDYDVMLAKKRWLNFVLRDDAIWDPSIRGYSPDFNKLSAITKFVFHICIIISSNGDG